VRRAAAAACAAAVVLATGCTGVQHALEPSGEHAARVATLFWGMLAVGWAVFVAVLSVMLGALWRRRPADDAEHREATDRRSARLVAGGVVATALILLGVLVGSIRTGSASSAVRGDDPLVVEVTGRQWWWHIRYLDPVPFRQVVTANELHLPVGRAVEVRLRTADVIHSFWVPRLGGKVDMIPGRTNVLRLRADEEGVFRGQCAEFCGLQHALMGMEVVAHAPEAFERWLEEQRRPAAPPADSARAHGERVFLRSSCALCHTVRGTGARGLVGPDLTHLASRRTLAAATLPNRRGQLAGWIVDPRAIKPGTHMPATELEPRDLTALLDYLQGLR
jgi:cytochrome c oxidase subunit II